MAEKTGTFSDDDDEALDLRPLLRLGAWGGCAVIALAAAVFTARSDIGERRAAVAIAALGKPAAERSVPDAERLMARATAAENEAKRLAETVRQLAADRDQLSGRLASLERNLDDLTGSIAKASHAAPGQSAPASGPAPSAEAPATVTAAEPPPADTTASVAPTPSAAEAAAAARQGVPLPRPAPLALIQSYVSPATPAPTATAATASPPAAAEAPRGEFAVDLGGAGSIDALRVQWNQLKAKHGALLDGLQPLVAVRTPRPGVTERRLIVGPLATPTAAARICAALSAAGSSCSPAVYGGQRLALR